MEATRRFVIQQHDATRLHWDLRLEHDGVLLSWALPRGVPWNPQENRLAIRTDDHPLDFLDHEGDNFDGQFGSGRSTRWDRGAYVLHKREPEKLVFTLHGQRATGKYSLFAMRGGRDWLIHRMDPPVDEHRRPVPFGVVPMSPTRGQIPIDTGDERWVYERRWDGIRALVTDDTGRVVVSDATAGDLSVHFPEVRRIGRAIGHREVILDGVIVPIDIDSGEVLPGRSGLERRLRIGSDSGARRAVRTAPVIFMAVDLLWSDGRSITSLPWELRRRQLDDLRLDGPGWRTSPLLDADEVDELAATAEETLIAKRAESSYRVGATSDDWVIAR